MKINIAPTKASTLAFFGFALMAVASLSLNSCTSSSTNPATTSTITATNDIQNETISGTKQTSPTPASGPTVDAITITKVRVLMSDLHLHVSDDAAAGVGTFMTAPMVVTFTPGATNSLGSATVPLGTYTQMIFDLHTPNLTADAGLLAANPDFVVGSPTIIIDGMMTKNGTQTAFTYKTSMVRNLKPVFTPSPLITIASGTHSTNLRFDGKIAFAITSGKPLDPTDPTNKADLDDQIAKAFLAQH
ncbi:MAG: hypothetical protein ABI778_06330 [Ignavibacteriota bacterium]